MCIFYDIVKDSIYIQIQRIIGENFDPSPLATRHSESLATGYVTENTRLRLPSHSINLCVTFSELLYSHSAEVMSIKVPNLPLRALAPASSALLNFHDCNLYIGPMASSSLPPTPPHSAGFGARPSRPPSTQAAMSLASTSHLSSHSSLTSQEITVRPDTSSTDPPRPVLQRVREFFSDNAISLAITIIITVAGIVITIVLSSSGNSLAQKDLELTQWTAKKEFRAECEKSKVFLPVCSFSLLRVLR